MSLLTHPTLSPVFTVSSTKSAAAAPSPGRPSGRDTRGERRPLPLKTSTQVWSTFVPCGASLPPRNNPPSEHGPGDVMDRPELEDGQLKLHNCDCARSDRDRTGVLDRVKVPRASTAAPLTRPPRAQGMATIGASGNHEREHEITPGRPHRQTHHKAAGYRCKTSRALPPQPHCDPDHSVMDVTHFWCAFALCLVAAGRAASHEGASDVAR